MRSGAHISCAHGRGGRLTVHLATYASFDGERQELTLTEIHRHAAQVEKLDVEGILAFAERD